MIWILNLVNTVIMFLANAEEFYTGMMRTNINGVGVTEIQFMQMAGLGFQGLYSMAYPGAKVGFFNRSLGFFVKEKFGVNYSQNIFSRQKVFLPDNLASILDVKLNHILIGYIAINAIVNAVSFLKGIQSSKKMSGSAKLKNLTGCFLVTGAGKTSLYLGF